MSAFRHKDTKEVVIPVPGGAYEQRLRDSDRHSEISTKDALKSAVGAEVFKTLPERVQNAVAAEPEATKEAAAQVAK
jgi:hypothetical protein